MNNPSKTQLIVAIIAGVCGVIGAAISNWDKLFHEENNSFSKKEPLSIAQGLLNSPVVVVNGNNSSPIVLSVNQSKNIDADLKPGDKVDPDNYNLRPGGLEKINPNFVKCRDVLYGKSEGYFENMGKLAKLAKLSDDGYFNRYQEDVVSKLCGGEVKDISSLIDGGYVKKSEVEAIKEVLGQDDRSDSSQSYSYSRETFEDMGLCNACAANIAAYYSKQPDSKCGKLARKALEGNPVSKDQLLEYPEYCVWKGKW